MVRQVLVFGLDLGLIKDEFPIELSLGLALQVAESLGLSLY